MVKYWNGPYSPCNFFPEAVLGVSLSGSSKYLLARVSFRIFRKGGGGGGEPSGPPPPPPPYQETVPITREYIQLWKRKILGVFEQVPAYLFAATAATLLLFML